jgi:hypothetical protein
VPRFTRRLLVALATVGIALTASGCGSVDAGAAAIDGDRRISVADVQTATVQVNRIVKQESQFDQRSVLSFLITEPYLVAEATRKGVGVSPDDARDIFRQFNFIDPITGSSSPAPATLQMVRGILALNRLQGRPLVEGDTSLPAEQGQAAVAAVSEQLKAADITVNPRYGSFEPVFDVAAQKIFPVTPTTDNWLVPSTPQPTPSQ